jgi:hypothetical protein
MAIKIIENPHEEGKLMGENTHTTIQKIKKRMTQFFKSSEQKEKELEQKEYEKNEKQFMEIFSELSLKQQLLLEQLLGDYIDDDMYPSSSFLHNFELALKNDKEI